VFDGSFFKKKNLFWGLFFPVFWVFDGGMFCSFGLIWVSSVFWGFFSCILGV
jgi:hypothetical protein